MINRNAPNMSLGPTSQSSTPDQANLKESWLKCPNCGASYDKPRHFCPQCHHYSSSWWDPNRKGKKRPHLKRNLIIAGLCVSLLVFLTFYWLAPYIPNPLVLLRQPGEGLSALSETDGWTGYGKDPANTRYIAHAPALAGRIRWSLVLGKEPTESLPAVADGVLYVGGYFKIYALKAATGELIWETETTGPVHSSPTVADSLVYVGLLDGRVLALSRSTGRIEWEYKTNNFIFSSPTLVGNRLYIGSGDQAIYALNAQTGQLIWKTSTEGRIQFAPAVQDDVLYVPSSDRSLYVLSAKSGAKRLRFRTYRDIIDAPVVANKLVYFVTRDGGLYTIRHKAREVPGQYQVKWMWTQLWLWRLPVPPPRPQAGARWRSDPKNRWMGFTSSPAVTPDALYLGDRLGWFYARDALKGEPLWEFRTRSRISASPLVLEDKVYFGAMNGNLYALNRHEGELDWKLSLKAPIKLSPVYAAGLLFLRTEDGALHAIE
ncbi:MAG: PQQ-binding-like beta-propeller repeat protein [Deltaproteobacteria bacterium]|nr:PQQ-binding-like beta-propeller repeat protein [Deltaproteobacteria bacterium]